MACIFSPDEIVIASSCVRFTRVHLRASGSLLAYRSHPRVPAPVAHRGRHNKYYHAKVLKVNRVGNGKFDLLMHYPGWNSRYDSWISHNEVLKDDEKNREFMARANAEYDRANASKAKKASAVAGGGAPSLKRKVDVSAAARGHCARPLSSSAISLHAHSAGGTAWIDGHGVDCATPSSAPPPSPSSSPHSIKKPPHPTPTPNPLAIACEASP